MSHKEAFLSSGVIEASNFKDNSFVPGVTEELKELGFDMGMKVKLKARITVNFRHYKDGSKKPPKIVRKDVTAGTITYVKGVANGWIVVPFTATLPGSDVESTVDTAVNPSKLSTDVEDEDVIEQGAARVQSQDQT